MVFLNILLSSFTLNYRKWCVAALLLIAPILADAQSDSTIYYDGDTIYYVPKETQDTEAGDINLFLRASISVFAINAVDAYIQYELWDDDPTFPEIITDSLNTGSLWSYGFHLGAGFLVGRNTVINLDNHIGIGDEGDLFNTVTQLGVGKEYRFGRVYVQPSLAIAYIATNQLLGHHAPTNKNYYEFDGSFIFDDLRVGLKSRAFALSPTCMVEYEWKRHLSFFARGSFNYTFWRTTFVSVSGETDETDNDGDYVSATERAPFGGYNLLDFRINGRQITNDESPYLNFNFNAPMIQVGISLNLSTKSVMEAEEWEE